MEIGSVLWAADCIERQAVEFRVQKIESGVLTAKAVVGENLIRIALETPKEKNAFISEDGWKVFAEEEKAERFAKNHDPFNGYSPRAKQKNLDAVSENEAFASQLAKSATTKQIQGLVFNILDTKLQQVTDGKQLLELIRYAESLGARAIVKAPPAHRYEDVLVRKVSVQQDGVVLIEGEKAQRRLYEPFEEAEAANAITFRVVCVM